MNKYLFLLLLFALGSQLMAQTERRDNEARRDLDYRTNYRPSQERPERFADNLWFGGGVQLGFQSSTFESFFNVGLSPMVGYKVTNNLSFGPRVSVNYNSYSQRNTGNDFSRGFFTWAAGMFGRMRVINPFFIHAEYSLESEVIGFIGPDNDPVRRNRGVPYLGAGYSPFNPGGGSSEVVVLFRLSGTSQLVNEAPFVVRAGLNFNF